MERFESKIDKTETCWLWTAGTDKDGYGKFGIDGKSCVAHRVAYELWKGSIPEGMVIDHLCRVKMCVRPEHLEAVTQQENLLRGETMAAENAAKTSCVNGHEFNEANTYVRATGRGCRECNRERVRKHRAKTIT